MVVRTVLYHQFQHVEYIAAAGTTQAGGELYGEETLERDRESAKERNREKSIPQPLAAFSAFRTFVARKVF
jgi:hypothetical protein